MEHHIIIAALTDAFEPKPLHENTSLSRQQGAIVDNLLP
jgi:hypothetical protein